MDNFLQHRLQIIEDFCNSFKVGAYKEIWGIDLNCNVKNPEIVWLHKTLLDYQTLAEQTCINSGCTTINISATTYCGTVGYIPFEQIIDSINFKNCY